MSKGRKKNQEHNKEVRREAKKLERQGWNVEADLPEYDTPEPIGKGGHIPDVVAKKRGATRIIEVDTPGNEDPKQLAAFRRSAGQKKRTTFQHIMTDK